MITLNELKGKKLGKLDLNQFDSFSLSCSAVRSLYGGAKYTDEHGGDFIDNKDSTHYDDGGEPSTDDTCSTPG